MFAGNLFKLFAIVVLLACPNIVSSQEVSGKVTPDLPSPDEVVERYILAKGGYELLASISSSHIVWKYVDNGVEWTFERWTVPGQYYAERSRNGELDQTYGCWVAPKKSAAGKLAGVAWRKRMDREVYMKQGVELQQTLVESLFVDGSTRWSDRTKSVKCVAKKKMDDRECYQLKFVAHDGVETDRYFDVETGYLRCTVTDENGTGEKVTRKFANHKLIGDVVVAMKQTIISDTGTDVWEIQSFERDVDIDIDRFELPEQVRFAINDERSKTELAKDAGSP